MGKISKEILNALIELGIEVLKILKELNYKKSPPKLKSKEKTNVKN